MSGCVGMGPRALLCTVAYDAVKTALNIQIFLSIYNSIFIPSEQRGLRSSKDEWKVLEVICGELLMMLCFSSAIITQFIE